MSAATVIANRTDIEDKKTYISAAVRYAIKAYLAVEQKRGLTGVKTAPDIIGLQDSLSDDSRLTVETTVADSSNFEQDILAQDEIKKLLPDGYHEVVRLKAQNPFASNAEIAEMAKRDVDAVESIIRRSRKIFDGV